MSISLQGGFLDHRMTRRGYPWRMSLTIGRPGLLIVLANIWSGLWRGKAVSVMVGENGDIFIEHLPWPRHYPAVISN